MCPRGHSTSSACASPCGGGKVTLGLWSRAGTGQGQTLHIKETGAALWGHLAPLQALACSCAGGLFPRGDFCSCGLGPSRILLGAGLRTDVQGSRSEALAGTAGQNGAECGEKKLSARKQEEEGAPGRRRVGRGKPSGCSWLLPGVRGDCCPRAI